MRKIFDSIGDMIETADQYMYDHARGTAYVFFGLTVLTFMATMLFIFNGWMWSALFMGIAFVLSWFACRLNTEEALRIEGMAIDTEFVQGAPEFSDR